MFTLDWHGNEDAEEAGEGGHKCAHIIALDNGNFCAQPNPSVVSGTGAGNFDRLFL